MAVEIVKCSHCNGSGKELKDARETRVTCNFGFEHVTPAIKAGSPCRQCGGDGKQLSTNFGRQ